MLEHALGQGEELLHAVIHRLGVLPYRQRASLSQGARQDGYLLALPFCRIANVPSGNQSFTFTCTLLTRGGGHGWRASAGGAAAGRRSPR